MYKKILHVCTCDSSGRMVIPACPPMTGTLTLLTSSPFASATKVLERTMSNVVTPKILREQKLIRDTSMSKSLQLEALKIINVDWGRPFRNWDGIRNCTNRGLSVQHQQKSVKINSTQNSVWAQDCKGRPLWIIASSFLENLWSYGYGRVDRICDDQNHCLGAVPGISDRKLDHRADTELVCCWWINSLT